MTRQNTLMALMSSVALLAPSVLHAQAVGNFARRSGLPASPSPVMPPPNTAPIYGNNSPVYTNGSTTYNNAPTYSNGPIFRTAPSAPAVPQTSSPPVFTNRVYSNAPVYQNTMHNNAPDNAPVYHTGLRYRNPPVSGSTNSGVYNGPVFTGRTYRITTPHGSRNYSNQPSYNNYPIYGNGLNNGYYGGGDTTVLLGGYYYGNYCDVYAPGAYPSVYGYYGGFPTYVVGPGVTVSAPAYPIYITSYLPFNPPSYPVTYNQTNYYVGSPERVREVADGGEQSQQAIRNAVPADSFQAAFGDIEQAWQTGNVGLLRKHIRDEDTKISVFLKNKYAYSLASGDLIQITRDAFDRLDTVSFQFDHLRKAKNGDVTAYGQHIYHSRDGADGATPGGDAVPFTTDGGTRGDSNSTAPAAQDKTVYVSYTLRHGSGLWYIVGVNSSLTPVIKQ